MTGTSIVIPVWNAPEVTERCLDALQPTLRDQDTVIVVDNGSDDKTRWMLCHHTCPGVLIRNHLNRGFAEACNLGATARPYDNTLIFLNSDTVPEDGWQDTLCAPLHNPEIAASGPMSNYVSGIQQAEPGYLPADHWGEHVDVMRLVAFCIAVRRDAFTNIGGFDAERFPLAYSDDDLCRRLIEAGWRLQLAKDAWMSHIGHGTFDANNIDWYQEQQQAEQRYSEVLEGR